MKKVLFVSLLLLCVTLLMANTIIVNSSVIRLNKWDNVKDEEVVPFAFVFTMDLHSWEKEKDLEDNEFLLNKLIDYCQIWILIKKPNNLSINAVKIVFISPSQKVYEKNLSRVGDTFYAGQFTYSIEEALVYLNESGIWTVNLIFNNSDPYALIYLGDSKFTNSSEIHIFRGLNINVYTNLEYQQLRVAKAMEDSARWSIISTIALFVAAIAAIATIIFYWLKYKEEQKEKMIEKWVQCKIKFDDVLLDLLILVTEVKTWLIGFNKLDKLSPHHYTKYQIFDNEIKILHKKCLQNLLYISKYPVESGNIIKKTKKIIDKSESIIVIWNKLQIPFTNDDSKNKINEIIANIDEIIDDINDFLNYE